MITDKEGRIFDDRRKKERRVENIKVDQERRKTERRADTKQIIKK